MGAQLGGRGNGGSKICAEFAWGEEKEVGNDLPFGPWSPAIVVGYVIGMGML